LNLAVLRPAISEYIVNLHKKIPYEPAFLVSRLSAWSEYDDRPFAEPIIEFASAFYKDRPQERDLVCAGIHDAWKIARLRPDPWDLSAWVYHGYARGQRFGLEDPIGPRAVLEEIPADERYWRVRVYRATAIGSGCSGETFDPLAATLRYFAMAHNGVLGRFHSERRYPRLQMVKAYENAVWTGILAAIPIDLSRFDAASEPEAFQ
jgi:hypothetical protein